MPKTNAKTRQLKSELPPGLRLTPETTAQAQVDRWIRGDPRQDAVDRLLKYEKVRRNAERMTDNWRVRGIHWSRAYVEIEIPHWRPTKPKVTPETIARAFGETRRLRRSRNIAKCKQVRKLIR